MIKPLLKKGFLAGVAAFFSLVTVHAQPDPVYRNLTTLNFPPALPIDATTLENQGVINASDFEIPWDSQNTLFFQNTASGIINVQPGARFEYNTGSGVPSWQQNWTNLGSISATGSLVPGTIRVSSTNIYNINGGLLSVDRGGLIRLLGDSINLFGGRLRAGDSSIQFATSEGATFAGSQTYQNPGVIREDAWAAGDGGNINLFGVRAGFSPGYSLTSREGFGQGGFSSFNPLTTNASIPGYSYFVRTNFRRVPGSATDVRGVVQAVFVQTNLQVFGTTNIEMPNISVYTGSGRIINNFDLNEIVVEFSHTDTDPTTGLPFTRYVQFSDRTATNVAVPVLYQNSERIGVHQSQNYGIFRSSLPFSGNPIAPGVFDPDLFLTTTAAAANGRYLDDIVNHSFSAGIWTIGARDFPSGGFSAPGAAELTNSPGRIEIEANNLDLSFSQLKAENYVSIKATNITSMLGATIDSPSVNVELLSTNSGVSLGNVFPSQVQRLNGTLRAWSGRWNVDQAVTNTSNSFIRDSLPYGTPILAGSNIVQYTYHVLILDNQTTTNTPVLFENLRTGNNLNLSGTVTVNKELGLNGECVVIESGAALNLSGTNLDFTSANAPILTCFTNLGTFSVPQQANFGFDRAYGYSNVVNKGLFSASSVLINTRYFENTNILVASNGLIRINGSTNRLIGGSLTSTGNLQLEGSDLVVSNSLLQSSAGRLLLSFNDRLSDGDISNRWSSALGVSLLQRPVKGDLLSTEITASVPAGGRYFIEWSGEDRGVTYSGFANNGSLGRLILDGSQGSQFIFNPIGVSNALYVDTLEFRNFATNSSGLADTNNIFALPGIKIYFVNANVPAEKLTNAYGGRFVLVDQATRNGPTVSVSTSIGGTTNITAGALRALAPALGDFDADGVPNELDTTPLSGFTVNSVSVSPVGGVLNTIIRWQAALGYSYQVEFKTSLQGNDWHILPIGTITPTAEQIVTVLDPVSGTGQRFYRVRFTKL